MDLFRSLRSALSTNQKESKSVDTSSSLIQKPRRRQPHLSEVDKLKLHQTRSPNDKEYPYKYFTRPEPLSARLAADHKQRTVDNEDVPVPISRGHDGGRGLTPYEDLKYKTKRRKRLLIGWEKLKKDNNIKSSTAVKEAQKADSHPLTKKWGIDFFLSRCSDRFYTIIIYNYIFS